MTRAKILTADAYINRIEEAPDGMYAVGRFFPEGEYAGREMRMRFDLKCPIPQPELIGAPVTVYKIWYSVYTIPKNTKFTARPPEIKRWVCNYTTPARTRRAKITSSDHPRAVRETIELTLREENAELEPPRKTHTPEARRRQAERQITTAAFLKFGDLLNRIQSKETAGTDARREVFELGMRYTRRILPKFRDEWEDLLFKADRLAKVQEEKGITSTGKKNTQSVQSQPPTKKDSADGSS